MRVPKSWTAACIRFGGMFGIRMPPEPEVTALMVPERGLPGSQPPPDQEHDFQPSDQRMGDPRAGRPVRRRLDLPPGVSVRLPTRKPGSHPSKPNRKDGIEL